MGVDAVAGVGVCGCPCRSLILLVNSYFTCISHSVLLCHSHPPPSLSHSISQDVLGIDPANDRAVSAAMLTHVKALLEPTHAALAPNGPLGGNPLDNIVPRPSTTPWDPPSGPGARNKGAEGAGPLQPLGPAVDPLALRLLGYLGVHAYR